MTKYLLFAQIIRQEHGLETKSLLHYSTAYIIMDCYILFAVRETYFHYTLVRKFLMNREMDLQVLCWL